jgi:hypothetical protein
VTDNQVLLDAARMLENAARTIKKIVKTTACTPEFERKLLSEVHANINAALARIQE